MIKIKQNARNILLLQKIRIPLLEIIIIQTMDVKSIVKKKGYTLDSVAQALGITRVTLSQNLSRNPTVNTLQKIADVIGCKVCDFFDDERVEDPNTITCPKCGARFKLEE